MFFKALNDSAGLNSLVLTLLVLSSYFYMTNINTPLFTINQCNIAICNAMEGLKRFYASDQVTDILNT